jgi:hypothetical protein
VCEPARLLDLVENFTCLTRRIFAVATAGQVSPATGLSQ